ncbi:hypothetical protein BDY24DRAFT_442956 [Mrakia frigida]|uniref:uncharacterized protein n=1 Tax=Mrakia frigida TaxID=29902 RepID=UPI003FCBF7B3
MSDFSPLFFADLLGLTEGIDAPPAEILSSQQIRQVESMTDAINAAPKAQRIAFFEQLSSLYLPCLLRTLLQSSLDPYDRSDRRWFLYEAWTARACETQPFSRLVREYPKEGCELWLRLIKMVAEFPESLLHDPSFGGEIIVRLLSWLDCVTGEALKSLPPISHPTLPTIHETTRKSILRLVPRLHALQAKVGLKKAVRKDMIEQGLFLIWEVCEAKNGGKGVWLGPAPNGHLKCTTPADGQEMQVCSRLWRTEMVMGEGPEVEEHLDSVASVLRLRGYFFKRGFFFKLVIPVSIGLVRVRDASLLKLNANAA